MWKLCPPSYFKISRYATVRTPIQTGMKRNHIYNNALELKFNTFDCEETTVVWRFSKDKSGRSCSQHKSLSFRES